MAEEEDEEVEEVECVEGSFVIDEEDSFLEWIGRLRVIVG